jgi:hypothetical protein
MESRGNKMRYEILVFGEKEVVGIFESEQGVMVEKDELERGNKIVFIRSMLDRVQVSLALKPKIIAFNISIISTVILDTNNSFYAIIRVRTSIIVNGYFIIFV